MHGMCMHLCSSLISTAGTVPAGNDHEWLVHHGLHPGSLAGACMLLTSTQESLSVVFTMIGILQGIHHVLTQIETGFL